MNKESRRAELAGKLKSCFQSSDMTAELELYSHIMNKVYSWQREDGQIVTLDSISNNMQLSKSLDR